MTTLPVVAGDVLRLQSVTIAGAKHLQPNNSDCGVCLSKFPLIKGKSSQTADSKIQFQQRWLSKRTFETGGTSVRVSLCMENGWGRGWNKPSQASVGEQNSVLRKEN